MHSLFRGAREHRFDNLDTQSDLWRLLVTITSRKAINRRVAAGALKRGGGQVRGESVFEQTDGRSAGLDEFAVDHLAQNLSIEAEERLDSLADETLQQIALLKLAGHTHGEIADQLRCTISTIDLKVKLIKKRWSKTT